MYWGLERILLDFTKTEVICPRTLFLEIYILSMLLKNLSLIKKDESSHTQTQQTLFCKILETPSTLWIPFLKKNCKTIQLFTWIWLWDKVICVHQLPDVYGHPHTRTEACPGFFIQFIQVGTGEQKYFHQGQIRDKSARNNF